MSTNQPRQLSVVPRRGNRASHAISLALLRLGRWHIEGTWPEVPRAVIVVAPHSSNWDFVIGALAMLALGLRLSWLGKHSLFWWPLSVLMEWLGGIPVRRGKGSGMVATAVEQLSQEGPMLLALAPEGTRKAVARWKPGFSLIAGGAGVPVIPVALDWGRRCVRIGSPIELAGDPEADEATLRQWFAPATPRRPG